MEGGANVGDQEKDLPPPSMASVSTSKTIAEGGPVEVATPSNGEEVESRSIIVDRSAVEVMKAEGEGKMDPRTASNLDNPFSLFPEEVWENFMERLPHSTDIENVFKAVPGLEGHVMRNKYAWLFHQVAPFLHPWLGLKELLNCRGVNKWWRQGVDDYLENHPIQKAIAHHDNEVSDHSWSTETGDSYPKWEWFGRRKLLDEPDKTQALTRFKADTDNLPATHNPFVGRAVGINLGQEDEPQSWTRSLELLDKFGSHVWFLKLGIPQHYDVLQMCQMILDVLWLVPNLKTLDLCVTMRWHFLNYEDLDQVLEGIKGFLPPLPFLETLTSHEWDRTAASIGRFLAVHYSAQIRRLYISHLREEDCVSFPGLTELTLSCNRLKEETGQTLQSLRAPELTTLCLSLIEYIDAERGLSWNEVVSWLQPFKRIQSFHFNTHNFPFRFRRLTRQLEDIEPIASLKSLTVRTFRYDFDLDDLPSLFPSLEYIKVIGQGGPDYDPGSLRNQERIINNLTVWEKLPVLKQIILADMQDASITRRLTRAGAAMLKSQRTHPANPEYLESIFEDFDSMVLGTWGEEEQQQAIDVVVELDGERAVADDGIIRATGQ